MADRKVSIEIEGNVVLNADVQKAKKAIDQAVEARTIGDQGDQGEAQPTGARSLADVFAEQTDLLKQFLAHAGAGSQTEMRGLLRDLNTKLGQGTIAGNMNHASWQGTDQHRMYQLLTQLGMNRHGPGHDDYKQALKELTDRLAPQKQPDHLNPPSPTTQNEWAQNQATRMMLTMQANLTGAHRMSDVTDLERRHAKATFYADQAGNPAELARQLEELKDAIKEKRDALSPAPGAAGAGSGGGGPTPPTPGPSPSPGPGAGQPGHLQYFGQLLQQNMGAQGGQAVQGLLGRFLGQSAGGAVGGTLARMMGGSALGPIGLGVGAIAGTVQAFNVAHDWVKSQNAPARQEVQGMADLARQYGTDYDLLQAFRPNGFTNQRFRRLGYTASDAAGVAARYDRPGAMMDDTEAILMMSRTTGMDEGQMAGAAQTLSKAGLGRGGIGIDDSLRIMKLAMAEGVKDGLSSSETMQRIVSFAQSNLSEGRSTSERSLATFALLTGRMNNMGPVLQGDRGAAMIDNITSSLSKPGDPGLNWMMVQEMQGVTAKELGLSGDAATRFEAIRKKNPVQAAQMAMEMTKSLKNPALMGRMAKRFDQAAGGDPALLASLYQEYFGASAEEVLTMGKAGDLFNPNPTANEKARQGKNLQDDVQGGNKLANQTNQLNVASRDVEIIQSLTKLQSPLGNIEQSMSDITSVVQAISWKITPKTNTNAAGSQAGTAGQFATEPAPGVTGSDPNPIFAPRGAGTVGAGSGSGKEFVVPGLMSFPVGQRSGDVIAAAVRQVESADGTDASMNTGNGARGVYQIMAQNITNSWDGKVKPGGWDKDVLGHDIPAKTNAEAREWISSHPEEAEQIARAKLAEYEKLVRSKNPNATDPQVAMAVGALWHNGGKYNLISGQDGKLTATNKWTYNGGVKGGQTDGEYAQVLLGHLYEPGFQKKLGANPATQPGATQVPYRKASNPNAAALQAIGRAAGGQDYRITQGFGTNVGKFGYGDEGHDGYDAVIAGGKGASVRTPYGGKVQQVGFEKGGWGNFVRVMNSSGTEALIFAHLNSVSVRNGQTLAPNQEIGKQGNTGGNSTGTHLHIEPQVRENGRWRTVNDPNAWYAKQEKEKAAKKGGFRAGGYTGSGPRDQVAGEVHNEEWVLTAEQMTLYQHHINSAGTRASSSGSGRLDVHVHLTGEAGVTVTGDGMDANARRQLETLWGQLSRSTGQIIGRSTATHNHQGVR